MTQITLHKRRCVAVSRTAIYVLALALACASSWPANARADTEYYRHSFFDNSLTPDVYYYSSGKVSAPSTLVLVNGKLPVETEIFLTPPNAVRFEWKSVAQGGWEAQVDVVRFRNREIRFNATSSIDLWTAGGSNRSVCRFAGSPVTRTSSARQARKHFIR